MRPGLVCQTPIFAEWSTCEQRLFRIDESPREPSVPNQLFYVSRAISEDARSVFYSENELRFSDQKGCGLRNLLNLGPTAWKSLRNIVIQIGTQRCRQRGYNCHGEVSPASAKTDVLPTWRIICSRLATYQQGDQLELRLVCGAASKETATAFLDPIQNLPRLRGLSIRMGPLHNPDLQYMIMETIQQKTKFFPLQPKRLLSLLPKGSFPFRDLPVELQIRILEYSCLISPEALVYQLPYNHFIPIDCWAGLCTALTDPYIICQGSYCPSTHTAFSNLYPCWVIQHGLFLINKPIRELALSVYYSKNTFEIICDPWESPNGAEVQTTRETKDVWSPSTSRFIRQLPAYSWQYLRHIHFKFGYMPDDAFHINSTETLDWLNTLSVLSQALPLSRLTLGVSFGPPDRRPVHRNKAMKQLALFHRIVQTIVPHRGIIKDFFIHIYGVYGDQEWPMPYIEFDHEKQLEWRVMGGDYDSISRGKTRTPFSYEERNG
ncbi:hypothetical protein BDW59DRAFT_161117 [Aspergillus cavernicola]|uniref:F-box domain-containing protein n=1 Tax=Aspergillus cavernicola TaxID=176166 RepID=A0ABR4IET7_9EURO